MALDETISAVLTGVGGLVTALSGIYVVKNKRVDADTTANYQELLSLRKEVVTLRRKDVLYARWHHQASMKAAQGGYELEPFPSELEKLVSGEDDGGDTGSFKSLS